MAKDIRNVALTWRQVLAILSLIASIILGLVSLREVGIGPWFALAVISSAFFFIWHSVNVRKPDIHPDILAQLFGGDLVSEIDTIHFLGYGRQIGSGGAQVRAVVLLQNVYEGPVTGRLQLNPKGTTYKIPQANLPLEYSMAGAEVLACWRDLPVPVTSEVSFGIEGFIRKNHHRRVRFKRRTAIRSDSASEALLVAGLLAGHISYHSASRLNIKLESPPADALTNVPPGPWEIMSLWSLEDQRSLDAIRDLLRKLMEERPSATT